MDLTISLGNILSIVTVVITILTATWHLSLKISRMEWKLDLIWKWYVKEHNISDQPPQN